MENYNKGFVYFICIVSAMGGLLFGYDWVVIGGAKIFYEQYFGIVGNPSMQGLAMSIALAGCLIGALTAGLLADKLGRKLLLLVSAFMFMVTAYGTGAFNSFALFLAVRFFGGIAIGIASGLSPMYIAEVAPASIRGRLVSLNQLTIVAYLRRRLSTGFWSATVTCGTGRWPGGGCSGQPPFRPLCSCLWHCSSLKVPGGWR